VPATYSFSIEGVKEYSCADEGSVKSVAVTDAYVQIQFVVNTSSNLELATISASGAVQYADPLNAGETTTIGTNVGVYWVVEKAGGGCLGLFWLDGGQGYVTINQSSG
jgi:hypothetical protein